MQRQFRIALVICIALALCVTAIFWRKRAVGPPVITVHLLGYTNRIGPFAILAITNRSPSAVTLDPQSVVHYKSASTPWIEANALRVARLGPNKGFVQEIFVFPAGRETQWKFEGYAAYSSPWLDTRRAAERWYLKYVRRVKWTPISKTRQTFHGDVFECPP